MSTTAGSEGSALPSSPIAENVMTDQLEASFTMNTSIEDVFAKGYDVEEEKSAVNEGLLSSTTKKAALPSPCRKSKRIQTRRKARPSPKYLRDAITVDIPLNVCADLKIAIQRTRLKRIRSLHKAYPSLKKVAKKSLQGDDDSKADDQMDEDEGSNLDPAEGKENNKPSKKKKKILSHVPQPEQYGSVLDYLEAKYVRGVMLGDEEADGASVGDGSEGAGSIYSGGSFLDDTDLQRDVAEQVMANTTLTKLELEDEDGEFFVNVGNLEVEENQYGEDYDPAQDKEVAKATKKRKKVQVVSDVKKPANEGDEGTLAKSSTSVKAETMTGAQKKKVAGKSTKVGSGDDEVDDKTGAADQAKEKSEALFRDLAAAIKKMTKDDLPRRKKNLTVSLTCPPNKNPGDMVTFTNPLNKEQRLRAKIPKNIVPGGTFRASVPLPKEQIDESADTDSNRFSRDFQELADDYARAYDHWCNTQAETDQSFSLLKEKRQKWDNVIKLFPKDLLTPIDIEYMSKITRRARQNRKKRQKTAESSSLLGLSVGSLKSVERTADDKHAEDADSKEEDDTPSAPQKRIVNIPRMGSAFPTVVYRLSDFDG